MLSNYIEQELGANDQAVIASASGQIGFLQQVTGEKEVLRAAIERLKYRPMNLMDTDRPRMSVYQAVAIERNDGDVLKYFEDVLLQDILAAQYRINPAMARAAAERMTRNRAGRLVRQADVVAQQTLIALDSAVRSSAQIPGRKLFVFLSDGFLVNNQNPDIRYKLQRVTDAAVRAGAVLYTIQASGLNTTFADASSDAMLIAGTGTGYLAGEDTAVQDPLTELAADTGGKALLNANDLNRGMKRALQESNDYYLLAWRPETEGFQGKEFHRIEVSVRGRSDLSVLVQRGFFNDEKTPAVVRASAASPRISDGFPLEELAAAIKGKPSDRRLTTSLTANYLDVPNRGASLSILMQVNTNPEPRDGQPASVDIGGIIYNDSGKVAGSFVDTLKPEKSAGETHITYLNQMDLKPGLYQVRVAARDANGSIGAANQWVRLPDLASRRLSLSSLLIGERDITSAGKTSDAVEFQKAQLKTDRRFVQDSRLRFLTFIYNAARGSVTQSPQLEVRVELFHNNRAVVSTPALAVETKGVEDPARIPYAGEFNLASLPKGSYVVRVTVTDRSAKTNASQEAAFTIE
jgi:VWFA-related protein